jgi:mannose-6-phosphate isomerase-like protein (cupin superfamily)
MKFTRDKARRFGWKGIDGWAYLSREDFPEMSCSYIIVTGRHGRTKSLTNNRIYFVIEGRGEFIINDKSIRVSAGEAVVVPKNTPYDFRGDMKLFLVNSPAFDPEGDIKLEQGASG